MLYRDLANALDPVLWALSRGLDADPWQADVLRSMAPRTLMCCSRQSGKTLTAAAAGLHLAKNKVRSLVLILSPSMRQSGELFRNVKFLNDGTIPAMHETQTLLELGNGSRVICLPGTEKTIRSFSSVDLLIIDEASRTADELAAAARPMLAVSEGRMLALTTPFGKRGWFWKAWAYGGDYWARVEVSAHDCPRITPEYLARELEELGAYWFAQEYENKFWDPIDSFFREEDIVAALDADIEPLYPRRNDE